MLKVEDITIRGVTYLPAEPYDEWRVTWLSDLMAYEIEHCTTSSDMAAREGGGVVRWHTWHLKEGYEVKGFDSIEARRLLALACGGEMRNDYGVVATLAENGRWNYRKAEEA